MGENKRLERWMKEGAMRDGSSVKGKDRVDLGNLREGP